MTVIRFPFEARELENWHHKPGSSRSNQFDRERREPDFLLLEARFDTLLELNEELAVLQSVGHIHKHPGQCVG